LKSGFKIKFIEELGLLVEKDFTMFPPH